MAVGRGHQNQYLPGVTTRALCCITRGSLSSWDGIEFLLQAGQPLRLLFAGGLGRNGGCQALHQHPDLDARRCEMFEEGIRERTVATSSVSGRRVGARREHDHGLRRLDLEARESARVAELAALRLELF